MKINWSFIEPVRDQAARLRGDFSAQSEIVKLAEQQAEIDRLREENARLREALKPISDLFLYPDDLSFEHAEDIRSDPDWDDDANDLQSENVFVLRRDIRRARAAIREGGND